MTVMLMRRFLIVLVFGCLVGGLAPAAGAAEDPGAVVAALGEKALAEIKNNAAARPQMEAGFKVLLDTYFDVPSISRFVLAR